MLPTTNSDLPLSDHPSFMWLDAQSANKALQEGSITSEQLVMYYLQRIAQNNSQGYELSAIVTVNEIALVQARQCDAERADGKVRSPLHGLPVVLKANIATADAMPTTAGALALEGHLCSQDASLVTHLRQSGAVILAKANLSEWANFRGEYSSSGWSALGGQVKNPHLLTHSPSGSSSGSAVAVAADLSLLAVGTETDGSIVCPSAINGIVGIKPTRGAVSSEGIIPIAHSQDIAGPMARDVYGAALLLDALATEAAKSKFDISLAQSALNTSQVKKVAIVRAFDDRCSALAPMFNSLSAELCGKGITCVNVDSWQLPELLRAAEFKVLIYEFKRDLEQWLTDYQVPESVNTMAKIVAFNQQHSERALAFYGQEYLEQSAAIDLDTDKPDYENALALSRRLAEDLLNEYLDKGFDAVILPTASPSWPIDHKNGDKYDFFTSTAAAVSGYPTITIPAAFEGVLPLGISLVGLPWSEPQLISLAAGIEQCLNAYRRPTFLSEPPWNICV